MLESLLGERAILDRVTVDAAVGASVVLSHVARFVATAFFAVPFELGAERGATDLVEPLCIDAACLAATRHKELRLAADG